MFMLELAYDNKDWGAFLYFSSEPTGKARQWEVKSRARCLAMELGDRAVIRALASRFGWDLEVLEDAARYNYADIMALLIQEPGAQENADDVTDALVTAVYNGYTDIVRLLAPLSKRCQRMHHAIAHAAAKERYDIVAILRAYGARSELADKDLLRDETCDLASRRYGSSRCCCRGLW
jgi:hypothetical protein